MAGENEDSLVDSLPGRNDASVNHSRLDLSKLRKLVKQYMDKHEYQTALFWADKITTISNGDTQDVYLLAQCLYMTRQYHRAAFCIKSRGLHQTDLACRHLAAKSHFAGKEINAAMETVDLSDCSPPSTAVSTPSGPGEVGSSTQESPIISPKSSDRVLNSSIALLKGQIYEAMDNRGLAAECYREALSLDVFNYEAMQALVQHQMLSKTDEQELVASLPFSKQCTEDEAELVKLLYETLLKKYDKPDEIVFSPQLTSLQDNLDLATALAERHYYNCDYRQCYVISKSVLTQDPFHTQCLPIHISCLMELDKSNALFYLAHRLVDLYPESAISWFAVGCYYMTIKKMDAARRYLSKATTLDRVFGPAWLVYGHSFAVENEHDQAMAAYFRASQLMKGCHLPLLYIGLEYGLTNNTKLAERFFHQALSIAPEDPFVLHELGVIAFQNQDYLSAEKHFRDALDKVLNSRQTIMTEKWEPLFSNLGHTCRKLKKYKEALEFHQQALVLAPYSASSFSAIGYVHSLMCNWSEAVEYFHKALGLQRDDTFSTTMLGNVIEQLMHEMPPCEDIPDELPLYEMRSSDESTTMSASDLNPVVASSTDSTSVTIEVEMESSN